MNAPTNSPAKYLGVSLQPVTPSSANPNVTAGFRCAPLNCPTANTAMATAMPHPHVMTIQPLFCALDCASSTAATTPSPSRIRIAVPMTSAGKMPTSFSSSPPRLPRAVRFATLLVLLRHCQTAFDNVKQGCRPQCLSDPRRLCRTGSGRSRRHIVVVFVHPIQRALDRFAPLPIALVADSRVHPRHPLARDVPVLT